MPLQPAVASAANASALPHRVACPPFATGVSSTLQSASNAPGTELTHPGRDRGSSNAVIARTLHHVGNVSVAPPRCSKPRGQAASGYGNGKTAARAWRELTRGQKTLTSVKEHAANHDISAGALYHHLRSDHQRPSIRPDAVAAHAIEGSAGMPAFMWEVPGVQSVGRGNPSIRGRLAARAWHDLDPGLRKMTKMKVFARTFGVSGQAMGAYVDPRGNFKDAWYGACHSDTPRKPVDAHRPRLVETRKDTEEIVFPMLTAGEWATLDAAMHLVRDASSDGW